MTTHGTPDSVSWYDTAVKRLRMCERCDDCGSLSVYQNQVASRVTNKLTNDLVTVLNNWITFLVKLKTEWLIRMTLLEFFFCLLLFSFTDFYERFNFLSLIFARQRLLLLFSLEILRGKLARGRPKIDPLAHALQGVCLLQILGEKGINISFAFNWYWSLSSEGALQ